MDNVPNIAIILDIMKEAGHIAQTMITDSNPTLKKDCSVITDADIAISQYVHTRLACYLQDDDHILVDEEDPDVSRYLNPALLKKTKYLWSLDPIDGTRLYANQIPSYGISLGVLRDLEPWMGAVYFPGLRELLFCDAQAAYYVREPFTAAEMVTRMERREAGMTDAAVFLAREDFFRKYHWLGDEGHIQIQACAVVDLCWPALGRACGSIFRSSLWDFAGAWPIFQAVGLQLRDLSSGEALSVLDAERFDRRTAPWKLKHDHILSSAGNFERLRGLICKKDRM